MRRKGEKRRERVRGEQKQEWRDKRKAGKVKDLKERLV